MLQQINTAQTLGVAAVQDADADSATVGQDAEADDLLSADALADLAAAGSSKRPFLTDNWLNRKTNYRLPWLFGYENWVYLLVLAALAFGLWWHFKKK